MPSSTATSGRSLRVARSIDYGYQPYDRLLDHEPNDNHQGEDEQDDFYDEYYVYDTSGIDRPSQKVIWVWSLLVTVFSIANIAVYAVLIHRAISIHSPVIKHWANFMRLVYPCWCLTWVIIWYSMIWFRVGYSCQDCAIHGLSLLVGWISYVLFFMALFGARTGAFEWGMVIILPGGRVVGELILAVLLLALFICNIKFCFDDSGWKWEGCRICCCECCPGGCSCGDCSDE